LGLVRAWAWAPGLVPLPGPLPGHLRAWAPVWA